MPRFSSPRSAPVLLAAACLALGTLASTVHAETRVTLKAAKAGSSYYQMAVQLAEAMKAGTEGEVSVTVEESQGSVQNVMEAAVRPGNYVFTSPPALIGLARDGAAMFEGRGGERFELVRALFPIPSLTMHFVASEASGIDSFEDMSSKTVLLGKGSWPAPNVIEAAASLPVTVLSLSDEQVEATNRTRLEIPAGTYAGQDEPIVTTSLPVVAYATTAMDDDTAYTLVRTYWENQDALGGESAWWDGVTPELLSNIDTELHPGAVRYYEEAGIALDDAQR